MIPTKFETIPELLNRADEACKEARELCQQARDTLERAAAFNNTVDTAMALGTAAKRQK